MCPFHRMGEVMTPAPFTVEADATVRSARSILLRERIHNLPVVERGRMIGILTDRDLHLVAYLCNDLLTEDDVTAGDICMLDPFVVKPEALVCDVAETMARKRIGAAMVVEDGELVGIFTSHDACRMLAVVEALAA